MVHNFVLKTFKVVFLDWLLELIYFPIWWYSHGFLKVARFAYASLANFWRDLALGIFLRSMFKPMYGDYSWEGRMISLIMRSIILIAKMIIFVAWLIIMSAVLLVWLLAFPWAIYKLLGF